MNKKGCDAQANTVAITHANTMCRHAKKLELS